MKYSVSAGRVKILLWLLVILQIFFSYSIIQGMFVWHTINLGLIQFLFYWFTLFAPIFLLWAYYQTKKRNNNLFNFCLILSLVLILVRAISMVLSFNALGIVYVLLYIDVGMFFKSKIRIGSTS
jgi:cell division protein FtsW (lipid II flippase)